MSSKWHYSERKKDVGKLFYEVYGELSNDGMGGHIIRCYACGGKLGCRDPHEVIKHVAQMFCEDCLPRPLGVQYDRRTEVFSLV